MMYCPKCFGGLVKCADTNKEASRCLTTSLTLFTMADAEEKAYQKAKYLIPNMPKASAAKAKHIKALPYTEFS